MDNQKVSKSKKNDSPSAKFAHKRERRYFSEAFRKARVKELEKDTTTVAEISRTYNVSTTSIYKWLEKYSLGYSKRIVTIIEPKSITKKMEKKDEIIRDLKQLIADQQVAVVYYEKLFEILEDHYGDELKKNMDLSHLSSLEIIKTSLKKKE